MSGLNKCEKTLKRKPKEILDISKENIKKSKDDCNISSTDEEFDAFKQYIKLNSPKHVFVPPSTSKINIAASSSTAQNFKADSNIFESSAVLDELESAISNKESIKLHQNKKTGKQLSKQDTYEKLSKTLSELINQKDLDGIFDEIENSICCNESPELFKKSELPNEILNLLNDIQGHFNTTLNDSMGKFSLEKTLNSTAFNNSFGSAFRNILLANKSKKVNVESQILQNVTFTDDVPIFNELGPFYGLPLRVKELIKVYKGIDKLYGWQDECLNLPAIKEKRNLIYALPTSGGKTLVAEILILREVLCCKKNAIFVLPYVSIVQEKVWTLSPFAINLDFLVEEYAGSKGVYPPRKRRRKNSVFIATIEKSLGIINSLIETDRLNELGLVIIDELHLIGEAGRGETLETMLTKLIYSKAKVQIVGMSATIGNLNEISKFLSAEIYSNDFRPVELTEYIKCGNEIIQVDPTEEDENKILTVKRTVNYNYSDAIKSLDPDQLAGLVAEVIPKGSCLVFCASKANCENVAKLLSRILFKSLREYKKAEKNELIKSLKEESGTLCDVLKFSLPFGVAYHHSGLTGEERKIIEDAFRNGVVSVICCTSTLAAGVNLPAQRVILRSPYIARNFINISRYKQMVGRAGRAGLGEKGESILLCTKQDLEKVVKLLRSPMDKAKSFLGENEALGLRQLVLSCIALGIANTWKQLFEITKITLWAVQNPDEKLMSKLTDKLIKQLFNLGALETGNLQFNIETKDPNSTIKLENTLNSEEMSSTLETTQTVKKKIILGKNTKLRVSKLGLAAIKGGLELSKAHILYEDLVEAQHNLVLLDILHLLYLVTPYDLIDQVRPDMNVYYTVYNQLSPKLLHTAKVLGITESVAVKMITNKQIKTLPERVLNRFYVTLILYDLWNEMSVFDAAEKYRVNRGTVQNVMQAAASFASNVTHFCRELEDFWPFAHLLEGMSLRLSHCCQKELLPLMELPSVKQGRAKQLYNAGYKTLQSIAKANAGDLMRDIEHLPKNVANQLISTAKMILLEKVENLREEAEDVLQGVEINKHNIPIPT